MSILLAVSLIDLARLAGFDVSPDGSTHLSSTSRISSFLLDMSAQGVGGNGGTN